MVAEQIPDRLDPHAAIEEPHREGMTKAIGGTALQREPALAGTLLVDVTDGGGFERPGGGFVPAETSAGDGCQDDHSEDTA